MTTLEATVGDLNAIVERRFCKMSDQIQSLQLENQDLCGRGIEVMECVDELAVNQI